MGGTNDSHTFPLKRHDQNSKNSPKQFDINIGSVNVCGLASKIKVPEFLNFISTFDILGIQESKTDETDNICVPGYQIYYNNREQLARRKSGGIALLVRDSLVPYIKVDTDKKSKLILWFTLSHEILLSNKAMHCGILYIPPYGSKYVNDDPYMEIQREIIRYCQNSDQILLMGDFNSRSGEKDDFCFVDECICDQYGLESLADESQEIYNNFIKNNIPFKRQNADKTTNCYGNQMIEFCKATNIFILNNRLGEKQTAPKFTCKDKSTIDYFLASSSLFDAINTFNVHDFCHLYSDAHCPISIILSTQPTGQNVNNGTESHTRTEHIKLWDHSKTDIFQQNFSLDDTSKVQIGLDKLLQKQKICQNDIDTIVNDIGSLFIDCAESSFGRVKSPGHKNTDENKKSWFNIDCKRARNLYHYARKLYNKYKTEHNKQFLKSVSISYKKTINTCIKNTKLTRINKLRKLRTTNPREYWKILNSENTKSDCNAPIDKLYDFFKNTNRAPPAHQEPSTQDLNSENLEINGPITETEIRTAIKQLKNGKASGIDDIKNEHMKLTTDTMIPIYIKLFNLVFDTGIIPESWSIGIIKPIYKNKGDPNCPENYRPITILSCLGKLFTLILNNRLKDFTEKYDIIDSCQAGFRKNYCTADNIFIIKSLIDIARANKNKVYCCFVDFKQAFDTVWRPGLWSKLREHHINGKCLTIIQNLYKDIKSKIIANGVSSAYFLCLNGVRQGENLSPILFSIFLNDLSHFLRTQQVNGITINENSHEISVYLKILFLLYADDTVLFSSTETDLQHTLDSFNNYCKTWHLTVNVQKTKVLIFNSRTTKTTFKLEGQILENVNEYKYLGVYLSKSGSFKSAKQHIAEQANKALFALLKKSRTLGLPSDIQIDLFDKTVKPILLYGSEIWGCGNCDVIERIHLKFLKYLFNLKKSTPTYMIYGELGILPLTVEIQSKALSFWCKLIENKETFKISSQIYMATYAMHMNKQIKSDWIRNIENLLCSLGFSGIWLDQGCQNLKWLNLALKQKLKDQCIQHWSQLSNVSTSSGNNYRLFKTTFECGNYFKLLPENLARRFLAFRTRNHRLPVEVGRWTGINLHERKCTFCNSDIGDEYHYLLVCKKFNEHRTRLVKPYYYKRPNILKYHDLMNTDNRKQLKDLCHFIKHIMTNVSY